MDAERLERFVGDHWDGSVTPRLVEYIRIPNKSPAFDPRWDEHGYMDAAVALAEAWCREQPLPGMTVEVLRLAGRTPLLLVEIAGASDETVLFYGHLDKQPEMDGWRDGLGPWRPVLEGERLYGRGGADDGYAVFASLLAIAGLQEQNAVHGRCLVLIECCEESGSFDLPYYIDELAERIGDPSLVICLDSGCGNYDQLWLTTSLRGVVNGELSVRVLREGVHSGDASGIVPSSFRIARRLLNRLEDPETGAVLPEFCRATIPARRVDQARHAAAVLQSGLYERFPFEEGVLPMDGDTAELILNRTWRPALSVTGAGGLPSLKQAGNVLRPLTSLQLSLRLPPTVNAQAVAADLKTLLEQDPPHGAAVRYEPMMVADGWQAPAVEPWLEGALDEASRSYFGPEAVYMGEGGSIPFMAMLGKRFPRAQFVITGVLGPHSNAHGPNEFLHLTTAKRLTCCVAHLVAAHGAARKGSQPTA